MNIPDPLAIGLATTTFAVVSYLVNEVRIGKREVAGWQAKWEREVQRGAQLAKMTFPSPPQSLPPPPWNEDTGIRTQRELLESAALSQRLDPTKEAILRQYLESTPPRMQVQSPQRPRQKSRPDR